MKKVVKAQFKQTSNIWAMLSAASFAAMFFNGAGIVGFLLGIYSFGMSMKLLQIAHSDEDKEKK